MTAHIAVSIADKYLLALGNTYRPNLIVLAATSILLGAKTEEHCTPCFEIMVDIVNSKQNLRITEDQLKDMEKQILFKLEFDVQWAGPLPFLERYLHNLDLNESREVAARARNFCNKSLLDQNICLKMRPS